MGEFQDKSHYRPKRTERLVSHLPKKYLDYPQEFWATILWTDETKVELFGRCVSRYIWRINNTAFHKRKIMPTVKHGGGSVMVFRTWTTCHNWWNHEFCTLSENPEGECPAISSSSTLGLCRTMIPNTPASPPLNGSRKTKLRFWSGQVTWQRRVGQRYERFIGRYHKCSIAVVAAAKPQPVIRFT